jgi:hypothetical protein
MANHDNRHHCYLSTILPVRTGVPEFVKQDRKRSLRDLMNEFSQSVPGQFKDD